MNILRPNSAPLVVRPPESADRLRVIAREALERADAYGTIPTPLDRILEAQKLELVDDSEEHAREFLKSLKSLGAKLSVKREAAFHEVLSKLKGAFDMRERKVWVQQTDGKPRWARFPQAHEISHDLVPWHSVRSEYLDDAETLAPETRIEFEREANHTAALLLFQGDQFRIRARDMKESIDSALVLADEHETTYHSTIWQFVEVQDRPIAIAAYHEATRSRPDGGPRYWHRGTYASEAFAKRFGDIEFPRLIDSRHEWLRGAADDGAVVSGTCRLPAQRGTDGFVWERWTNRYTVFVLVRRDPVLSLFGTIRSMSGLSS